MSTREEKIALRDKGLTYKQIAACLGISYQAVSQSLATYEPRRFHHITEKQCVYPGVRRWMNENKVTFAEFIRRHGKTLHEQNYATLKSVLNGSTDPRKSTIDKILCITGMSYEEAFSEGGKSDDTCN